MANSKTLNVNGTAVVVTEKEEIVLNAILESALMSTGGKTIDDVRENNAWIRPVDLISDDENAEGKTTFSVRSITGMFTSLLKKDFVSFEKNEDDGEKDFYINEHGLDVLAELQKEDEAEDVADDIIVEDEEIIEETNETDDVIIDEEIEETEDEMGPPITEVVASKATEKKDKKDEPAKKTAKAKKEDAPKADAKNSKSTSTKSKKADKTPAPVVEIDEDIDISGMSSVEKCREFKRLADKGVTPETMSEKFGGKAIRIKYMIIIANNEDVLGAIERKEIPMTECRGILMANKNDIEKGYEEILEWAAGKADEIKEKLAKRAEKQAQKRVSKDIKRIDDAIESVKDDDAKVEMLMSAKTIYETIKRNKDASTLVAELEAVC